MKYFLIISNLAHQILYFNFKVMSAGFGNSNLLLSVSLILNSWNLENAPITLSLVVTSVILTVFLGSDNISLGEYY